MLGPAARRITVPRLSCFSASLPACLSASRCCCLSVSPALCSARCPGSGAAVTPLSVTDAEKKKNAHHTSAQPVAASEVQALVSHATKQARRDARQSQSQRCCCGGETVAPPEKSNGGQNRPTRKGTKTQYKSARALRGNSEGRSIPRKSSEKSILDLICFQRDRGWENCRRWTARFYAGRFEQA